ncbi:hypothetical protein BH09PSE6_BH09PSE6_14380 [soil metagenome]
MSARLLDEAVELRQAEAGALADRLGREERFERLGQHVGRHAGAAVGDRQQHVLPRHHVAFARRVVLVEFGVGRLDDDAPALGHRIARVDADVEQRTLELVDVAARGPRAARQHGRHGDVFTDGAPDQLFHRRHHRVEHHRLGIERLTPRERQQALGQSRGAACRCQRGRGVAADVVDAADADAAIEQVEAADDAGQQVVEVVGDAAGELPDRFHLLGLAQCVVRLLAFGDDLGDTLFERLVEQAQLRFGLDPLAQLALRRCQQPRIVDRDRRMRRDAGHQLFGMQREVGAFLVAEHDAAEHVAAARDHRHRQVAAHRPLAVVEIEAADLGGAARIAGQVVAAHDQLVVEGLGEQAATRRDQQLGHHRRCVTRHGIDPLGVAVLVDGVVEEAAELCARERNAGLEDLVDDHRQVVLRSQRDRRAVDRLERAALLAQQRLGAAARIDVLGEAVPLDDATVGIAARERARAHPVEFAVAHARAVLDVVVVTGRDAMRPALEGAADVVGMDRAGPAAVQAGGAGQLEPARRHVVERAMRIGRPGHLRIEFDRVPVVIFLLAQRRFGPRTFERIPGARGHFLAQVDLVVRPVARLLLVDPEQRPQGAVADQRHDDQRTRVDDRPVLEITRIVAADVGAAVAHHQGRAAAQHGEQLRTEGVEHAKPPKQRLHAGTVPVAPHVEQVGVAFDLAVTGARDHEVAAEHLGRSGCQFLAIAQCPQRVAEHQQEAMIHDRFSVRNRRAPANPRCSAVPAARARHRTGCRRCSSGLRRDA